MASSFTQTLVEPARWEEIRRKVYLPQEADEYSSTSQPLADIIQESVHTVCSSSKPVKMGYINDLCREGGVSPCALVLGLLYIQRLAKLNPKYLERTTSSDVFLIALLVASKYLQDEGEMEALVNSEWAEIGHRQKNAVDSLERKFLEAISWNLYVSVNEYYQFIGAVQARVAILEAERRGWWSYTDLASLWDATESSQVMMDASKQTAKVVGGSMAAYVVCLATLVSTAHAVAVCADTNVANQLQTTSLISGTPSSLPGLNLALLDWNTPPNAAMHPWKSPANAAMHPWKSPPNAATHPWKSPLNMAMHPPSLDSLTPSNHQWHQTVVSNTAQNRHVGVHYPCASGHYQDLMMIMKSIFTAASVNCDSNRSVKTEPDPHHRDNRIIDRFENENIEKPSKHCSNSFTNYFTMQAY